MENKKVLFLTQEIEPYLPKTFLSDFSKKLPLSLHEAGLELRIFAPRFGIINERRNQLHDVIRLSGSNIIVKDTDHPLIVKVASMPESRLQAYFVDNDEFFKRKTKYGADEKHENSNAERSVFFIRGALEAIRKLRWIPDVIHCAGWFTGLAPLYLKHYYKDDPCFGKAKVVYTMAAQEDSAHPGENIKEILDFDRLSSPETQELIQSPSAENLQKIGLFYADAVSFVTPDSEKVGTLYHYAKGLNKPLIITSPDENLDSEQYSQLYAEILS